MKKEQSNHSAKSKSVSVSLEKSVNSGLLVRDIMQVMEILAPAALAEPWDRIGLQLGDPASPVDRVLIALDLTPDVLDEARNWQANLIICHHPAIFTPMLTIRRDDPLQNLLIDALLDRISVFVAHTNLDAASGGVADIWAAHLVQALAPVVDLAIADPAIAAGAADASIIDSERTDTTKVTPYGRMIVLNQGRSLSAILLAVADSLPGSACRINLSLDEASGRPVRRIASFPGSFPLEVLAELIDARIDTLICGECKYHDGLTLALAGIAVVSVGHDHSEQPVLGKLASRLAESLPQITFAVYSGMDYNKQAN